MKASIIALILFTSFEIATAQNNPIYFDPYGNAGGDTYGIKVTETGNNTSKLHLYRKFSYDTNDIDRFVIDSYGRIGIGTSNPSSLLTVNGILEAQNFLVPHGKSISFKSSTGLEGTTIRRDAGDNLHISSVNDVAYTFPNNNVFRIRTSAGTGVLFNPQGNIEIHNGRAGENLLDFKTDRGWAFRQLNEDAFAALQLINYEGGNKHFIISTTGHVGIGTTSPSHKLEVNGSIRAKEIKVEASPWPDYVFADNYHLSSLEETEDYINENHHLPEVPSAVEMEANGVNLGEMNMLLLKKIEELTLHLIEVKNIVTEQQKEIEILKLK